MRSELQKGTLSKGLSESERLFGSFSVLFSLLRGRPTYIEERVRPSPSPSPSSCLSFHPIPPPPSREKGEG